MKTLKSADIQNLRLLKDKGGFTLIELLIVISIIGLMFSVTLPVSYSMYEGHQASLRAEKALVLISSSRMESFLHGEEKIIRSKDGRMLIDGIEPEGLGEVFFQIDTPIKFYKTGATTGGEIKLYAGAYSFVIDVGPLSGNMTLRQAGRLKT